VDGGFNLDSGSNSSQINNVGIDFIREVAVKSSNFSASTGETPALVNVVTRSGAIAFMALFLSSSGMIARCEDLPWRSKGPLRFNDFGWDSAGHQARQAFLFCRQEWKRIAGLQTRRQELSD